MIKVQNNIATREPVPPFLRGLKPESLLDLSWTDPALGVSGYAWWPEENGDGELPENHKRGAETLTPDAARRVVVVTREAVPMTADEIAERDAAEAAARGTRLTVLAFRNRFTHAEKVGMEAAAASSPELRVFMGDLAVSTYVDLSSAYAQQGAAFLETVGLIATGRAAEIVGSPVQSHEVPG